MLFESRYVSDEQWFNEIYGYIYLRRPINLIIAGILAVYSILMIFIFKSATLLVVTIVLVAVRLAMYSVAKKREPARIKEMYGENVGVIASVFDDCIRYSTTSGNNFRVHYTDMKAVESTEHYILIFSKTNSIYTLKKEWFTHGNANDFMNFMRSKGIKVK